jgi:FkbM family methyltransferase
MIEPIYRRIWTAGVWLRNLAKRGSLLGPIEPLLLKLGPKLVPPPKTEVVVRLPFGMTMTVPPGYPSARSYSSGLYEPDVTRLFEGILRLGMTVVDAGANVGYYTLLASNVAGPTGRVYAFEPDPINFSYLVQNLKANGRSNVRAVRAALADTTGTGKFIQDSFGAEGFLTAGADGTTALEVPMCTLDAFFQGEGWPPVDIIKMDIEGSEAIALSGMRELSRRNPGLQVIMELNARAMSRSGHTADAVSRLLRDLGFLGGHVIEAGYGAFSLATGLPSTQATYNLHLLKG